VPRFSNAVAPSSGGGAKPTGVQVLVILNAIDVVVDFVAALVFFVLRSFLLSWLSGFVGPAVISLLSLVLMVLCLVFLLVGMASFVLVYGLWKGCGWAWRWALTSAVVGLATSIVGLSVGLGIVGVASNALIIYYLTRPEARAYFGKVALQESSPLPESGSIVRKFCTQCGNRLNEKDDYCSSCGMKT